MFRSSRTIASLIRTLTLGTAATVATATLATTVMGCKDESQPDYWIEKLDDASWRPRAIKRLEQFFEDASTKAGGDNSKDEVQKLLTKIIEPLTKCYVDRYSELDTKTRVSLIKLLAAFKDKRTEPALKKAFDEYAKRPPSSKDDQDIKWAASAQASLKLPTLGDSLLQAFLKFQTHTMLGGVSYRDMNEAMIAAPQKNWAGPLATLLAAPMEIPKTNKEADKIDAYRDQQFWQTTAALVLGDLRATEAVEPLLKVMLDPAKADVQTTAVLALTKIGKPAELAAIKLLKGEDDGLKAYALRRIKEVSGAKEDSKDEPYVATAALVLGTIGLGEAVQPMIDALKGTKIAANKAIIARELTKLPPTPESKQAFKEAYESTSLDTNIPPGVNALQMLTEAAVAFYDPTMVDWLLERAAQTKGSGEDLKALQDAIVISALKLAKPDQLEAVKKAVDAYGTQIEKDAYALTDKMLKACGDRVSCYLDAVEKSENQDQKTQFSGIKAGYMIGILGNEQSVDGIIERLDDIDNAAIRYVVSQVIDHLLPKGSTAVADKLDAIIQKNAKSADVGKSAGDAPVKQVMYRIRMRAE